MATIASPCILVCSIDEKSGYCFGCGRTGAEIQMWADYDPRERRHIMDGLAARLATLKRRPRRMTRRQILRQNQLEKRGPLGGSSSQSEPSL